MAKKEESKFDRVKAGNARPSLSKEQINKIGEDAWGMAGAGVGSMNIVGKAAKGAGMVGAGIRKLVDKIKGKGGSATEKFEEVMSKVDRPAIHKADAAKRAEMMKNVPSAAKRTSRKWVEKKNADDIANRDTLLVKPAYRVKDVILRDEPKQIEKVENLRLKDRFNKSKGRFTEEKVEGKNVSDRGNEPTKQDLKVNRDERAKSYKDIRKGGKESSKHLKEMIKGAKNKAHW